MDLSQLLIQTTIQPTYNEIDSEIEIETNVEPGPEPEPELEPDHVDDIISKDTIETDINMYKQPWNKLVKGMKMNRILLFVTHETIEKELSSTTSKELKQMLFHACDRGLLNKMSGISYNQETCLIETLKIIEYNEITKKYKLKSSGNKPRSVSKSRSNIDRLLKA
jgi:hypothetical protein